MEIPSWTERNRAAIAKVVPYLLPKAFFRRQEKTLRYAGSDLPLCEGI
jgi:hypothetical protein